MAGRAHERSEVEFCLCWVRAKSDNRAAPCVDGRGERVGENFGLTRERESRRRHAEIIEDLRFSGQPDKQQINN